MCLCIVERVSWRCGKWKVGWSRACSSAVCVHIWQTGRGSDGLVRGGEYRCQTNETSRKGKGKGEGGKGEHEGKGRLGGNGQHGSKGAPQNTSSMFGSCWTQNSNCFSLTGRSAGWTATTEARFKADLPAGLGTAAIAKSIARTWSRCRGPSAKCAAVHLC